MYRLVAAKLKRDPLELILQRRKEGASYAKIAFELETVTGEHHTAELVRRWDLHSQGLPYRRSRAARAAATAGSKAA